MEKLEIEIGNFISLNSANPTLIVVSTKIKEFILEDFNTHFSESFQGNSLRYMGIRLIESKDLEENEIIVK